MGKHVSKKKINYGGMVDEAITTTENESTVTPTPTKKNKMRPTPAIPSQREKYAPAHMPTFGDGERKTERLQLVVKPSTKSRLAEYARDHGTSSNEVVQRLLDNLLDDAGY